MKKHTEIHIEFDLRKRGDAKDYTLEFKARMLPEEVDLALSYLFFCFKDRMNISEDDMHDIIHRANDASEIILEQEIDDRLSEL